MAGFLVYLAFMGGVLTLFTFNDATQTVSATVANSTSGNW